MMIPRDPAPALSVPLLSGEQFTLAEARPEGFSIVIFYRGKHCPICRQYLQDVQVKLDDAAAQGIEVTAVSMDGEERARPAAEEWGLDRLRLGYGMSEATARAWGLYISSQRPGSQEPARFAEPGLAVVRPDGTIFFAQIQSAPFTRPDFGQLLGGLKFVVDNDYPARGDLTKAA
ncbi:MAG: peroxiredoxin-like family protein [Pseudomonadota bacterium]